MVNHVGLPGGHEGHFHPNTIEVCYIVRGRLDWWIGEDLVEIHSSDVVVMMPGVPHGSVDATLQPCEYYTAHIQPDQLPASAKAATNEPGFGGHHPGASETGELVIRLFEEHNQPRPYRDDCAQSLINLLCFSLARNANTAQGNEAPNYLVRRAMKAFFDEESRPRSVDEVARKLKVSTVWLTRVFRQELGQSPGEWIRSRQMIEAKRLLAQTDLSVIEISVRLGFTTSQYFATAFRRDTGLTPSAYRERCSTDGETRPNLGVVSAPVPSPAK